MNVVLFRSKGALAVEWGAANLAPEKPGPEDVAEEVARRTRDLGLETWRVRAFMTGRPIPDDVRFLAMQIAFAGEALARLDPIPIDFRADCYWPGA